MAGIQVTYRVEHAQRGILRGLKAMDAATDAGLEEEATGIMRRWGLHMRKRTRRLFRSRRREPVGGKSKRRGWRMYSDEKHAEVEERGSRPHVIRPRKARALRFTIGGRVVFAKSVRHPGTKGSKALASALRRSEGTPRIRLRAQESLAKDTATRTR